MFWSKKPAKVRRNRFDDLCKSLRERPEEWKLVSGYSCELQHKSGNVSLYTEYSTFAKPRLSSWEHSGKPTDYEQRQITDAICCWIAKQVETTDGKDV